MSIEKNLFGKLSDGTEINAYTLKNGKGMSVRILNLGGIINELRVPDKNGCFSDIIGGYDCLDSYLEGDGYQGALIGRYANRLNEGKFTLEGEDYELYQNNNGNHLHGGKIGYDKRVWDVTAIDGAEPVLELHLVSPDGEEGYPGTLNIKVTYTLTDNNGLRIRYEATTDKTTIINLTNHSYFNIGGYASGSIRDQEISIDADTYIPVNENLIPTGEILSVEGTPMDFRKPKIIGEGLDAIGGYDHCFNFVGGASSEPKKRCEVYDSKSGRVMSVYTDRPCVQFYTANFLKNEKYPFKGGYKQMPQTFLCLETQCMPDSINHEGFTNCILKNGEKFDTTTEYRFSYRK